MALPQNVGYIPHQFEELETPGTTKFPLVCCAAVVAPQKETEVEQGSAMYRSFLLDVAISTN